MSIPKTLIIGLHVHGEIPLLSDGNPMTKQMINQSMIMINAVVPGVLNISTFEHYNESSKRIAEIVASSSSKDDLELANEIQHALRASNEQNKKNIEIEYFNGLTLFQSFIHKYDNAFAMIEYKKGDLITNKLFYKFTQEELKVVADDNYFNKIIIYNMDETDLFELFASLGYNMDEITLVQLLDCLHGMGAENIILIDQSCSVFKKESGSGTISERQTRYLRRNIQRSSF